MIPKDYFSCGLTLFLHEIFGKRQFLSLKDEFFPLFLFCFVSKRVVVNLVSNPRFLLIMDV